MNNKLSDSEREAMYQDMLDHAERLREKLKIWKSWENPSANQRAMIQASEETLAVMESELEIYRTRKQYAHLRQKAERRFGGASGKDKRNT